MVSSVQRASETRLDRSGCPMKQALSLFEGKYSPYILQELLSGEKRFSEFLKNIPGISSKTLNDRLKYLTDSGIVSRRAYAEIPPKVEYSLTDKGREVEVIMDQLRQFGTELFEDRLSNNREVTESVQLES